VQDDDGDAVRGSKPIETQPNYHLIVTFALQLFRLHIKVRGISSLARRC